MKDNSFEYDFAISYAGEDVEIAQGIRTAITERYSNYSVFLGANERYKLVGQNGEDYFDSLFLQSRQVIVILSENYKRKPWTRYEWDIIKDRSEENRCIPVKIDSVRILGMSSNFIYLPFNENYDEIASLSIDRLLLFEKCRSIDRKTELQKLNHKLQHCKGAVDKAAQLVYDDRQRSPLGDIKFPIGDFNHSYKIMEKNELNFSKLRQLEIRIDLKDNLSKDEIRYNIKHLTAVMFNEEKVDAIKIFVHCSKASNFLGYNKFNVARADFAPYGDWGKAEEGFAYNLPVDKFDWKIEFEQSYFDKSKKIETVDEMAKRLFLEILDGKK